jgi:hypothetical protein
LTASRKRFEYGRLYCDAHNDTYLADDTSLEGATLETRQKQSSGLTGRGSSSASEESDSVETHDDFVVVWV